MIEIAGKMRYTERAKYCCFSYLTARGNVRDAQDIMGAGRLLWGSDMPSAAARDTCRYFIALRPGPDEAGKEKFLWANAERLFFHP